MSSSFVHKKTVRGSKPGAVTFFDMLHYTTKSYAWHAKRICKFEAHGICVTVHSKRFCLHGQCVGSINRNLLTPECNPDANHILNTGCFHLSRIGLIVDLPQCGFCKFIQ